MLKLEKRLELRFLLEHFSNKVIYSRLIVLKTNKVRLNNIRSFASNQIWLNKDLFEAKIHPLTKSLKRTDEVFSDFRLIQR